MVYKMAARFESEEDYNYLMEDLLDCAIEDTLNEKFDKISMYLKIFKALYTGHTLEKEVEE